MSRNIKQAQGSKPGTRPARSKKGRSRKAEPREETLLVDEETLVVEVEELQSESQDPGAAEAPMNGHDAAILTAGDEWSRDSFGDEPPARIFSDPPAQSSDSAHHAESETSRIIPREQFDEAGYLRLNPDVRMAIDNGLIESGYSHYLIYGSVEGRPLPDMPREPRNVMLTSIQEAGQAAAAPREARGSIDALLIAQNGGLMIVGWIDDVSHPLNFIRIIGPTWRLVMDASRFLRVRREDVEKAIATRRPHAFGFIGFVQFSEGGEASGHIRIELWQAGGASASLQCVPSFVEELELRDIMLTHLAAASFFGNPVSESMNYLDRGLGDELVRFNRAVTGRMVAHPYVERFGPQDRPCRGSIIVCLYGKAEFFFLQNAIFAGLPGMEDYEFIYVSNSPELAETLVREATSATLTYGLSNTIVVLPGNAGFGAANNAAARVARSGRLLIVNPDVFPRDLDWARKHTELIAAAPASQTRIFGVPLYYDDGSLMHGGMYFDIDVGLSTVNGSTTQKRICRVTHYGKGAPPNNTQYTRPRPVPAVTGAFISVDRSWFEQLGGFTEDFIFGHYEDADLCLKSLMKGTPSWLHDIRLWHLEGKGSTRQPTHEGGSIVNRWKFSSTWIPTLEQGLTGTAPTHPLLHPAETPSWTSDHESTKRTMDRRRKVI